MTVFADLHEMPEDQRIDLIGLAASKGKVIGVLLERHEPAKVERYIRKVTERYPNVIVIERVNGPTAKVVTIKFGPKHSEADPPHDAH
jgi:hypothetical protein